MGDVPLLSEREKLDRRDAIGGAAKRRHLDRCNTAKCRADKKVCHYTIVCDEAEDAYACHPTHETSRALDTARRHLSKWKNEQARAERALESAKQLVLHAWDDTDG